MVFYKGLSDYMGCLSGARVEQVILLVGLTQENPLRKKTWYDFDLVETSACEWSQRSPFPRLSTGLYGEEVTTKLGATFAVT